MKYIVTGIIIVIVGCVYMIREGGYNPKPILVMKSSPFETYENLGKSLYGRFYLEAKTIPHFIVFCDFSNCVQEKIWQSFISLSNKKGLKPRRYFSLNYYNKILAMENNPVQLINQNLNKDLSSNEYSIHILPLKIKDQLKIENIKSIQYTMTNYFVNKDEEKNTERCKDRDNLENLQCLKLGYSRRYYKKNFDPNTKHVGMEKVSHNKYLLYLH